MASSKAGPHRQSSDVPMSRSLSKSKKTTHINRLNC